MKFRVAVLENDPLLAEGHQRMFLAKPGAMMGLVARYPAILDTDKCPSNFDWPFTNVVGGHAPIEAFTLRPREGKTEVAAFDKDFFGKDVGEWRWPLPA